MKTKNDKGKSGLLSLESPHLTAAIVQLTRALTQKEIVGLSS